MRFALIAAALASATVVSAETITVMVGMNGTKTYTPSSVNASVGDVIAFQFVAGNHTVTQSTFAEPCVKMTTPTEGIDSSFQPVSANATQVPEFSFTVSNTSAPLWFYCRQTGHCELGMVFAVNPTATKSFAAFQAAAMASNTTTSNTTSTSTGSVTSSTAQSTSTSTASTANGAMKLGTGAGLFLTVVGLAAGLIL